MVLTKWIYVAFKGKALDSEELIQVFRRFGDPKVGKIVGTHHAYVKFDNPKDAARAVATMNGSVIDRKGPVEVTLANPGRDTEWKASDTKYDTIVDSSVVPRITPPIPKVNSINSNELQEIFEPITEDMVRKTHPFEMKDMLATRLRPVVAFMCPELGDKLTGMIVELDSGVVLSLLKDMNALKDKVQQAAKVLSDFRERKRVAIAE
ncbi:uncharacterized protein LOC126574414 [Anopheles aquasalis]|uniref:uncharacterized protein LOC126574414 n=1 Tax=Anopheles aquasalis TaxID=42839 RepID=UPI00215B42E1|nr:uncharacterized protein LOC126574414 [Anopheles aquasalis]